MKKIPLLAVIVWASILPLKASTLVVATRGYDNVKGTIGTYDADTGAAINSSLVTGLGPVSASPSMVISGNNAYVLDYRGGGANGTVSVYDISTGATVNSSLISGLNGPTGIAIGGNSLFVANQTTPNQISKYNIFNGQLENSAFISGGPFYGIGIFGDELLVSTWKRSGSISSYNLQTGAAINESLIKDLFYPITMAVDGNNLYVANFGDGNIGKYDFYTGATINSTFVAGIYCPRSIVINNGSMFVASDLGVSQYNAATGELENANFITGLDYPNTLVVIPEPSTYALFALGIVGTLLAVRRKRLC